MPIVTVQQQQQQQTGDSWPLSISVEPGDSAIVFKAENDWKVDIAENLGWQVEGNGTRTVTCSNVSPGTYCIIVTKIVLGDVDGSGSTSLEITSSGGNPEPPL